MNWIEWIPTANALLNLLSAIFLSAGLFFIKQGRKKDHQRCMVTAFGLSVLFLVLYVIRYAMTGPTPYTGPFRPIYLLILGTHTPLAAVTPVLALITISRALRGDFIRHKKIARITFPIWMYVSITGLIVYGMLHYLR
ncbi:DUF420 domain-containing protein [Candidatus Acetothermia bacterium]|nr:DUF420 domain-containing protein [Candidatus Acetothermia bacterium]MBI3660552.1 DUF420 domain-containing protein [Candidatus Acetothermia bacterium]